MISYPERWRDWPYDTSATGSDNTVPIPGDVPKISRAKTLSTDLC